jgi:Tfp pilus assembly protein PilN
MNSIGLTVSNNQAVMVLVKKELRGGPFLEQYRLVSLKEVNPEDREAIILSNIEGFIDEHKGDRDNFFLGIPGDKVIFKRLFLPSPTEENLKEVLGFEMDRYTPFVLEDVHFDFKIVKRDEEKKIIHVLLMVVKKDVVEYYLNLLQKINIRVRGMEVLLTALYNVTAKEGQVRKKGLDKGWIARSSGWFKVPGWGKKLLAPFDRFLSKGEGEETFTEENSKFLININDGCCEVGVVRDNAFVYSRHFNLSPLSRESGTDKGMKARADEILSEIETTRVSLTDDDAEISQLIVSGSEVDQDLVDYLKEEENVDAKLLDDPNIEITTGDAREKIACLSTAIGLALKGVKGVALDINFIPRELRPKRKKNWSLICGVTAVGLLLLGISSCTVSYFVRERIYLSGLSERVGALKGRVRGIEQMQEEIAEIKITMDTLERIKADDVSKLEILKELTQIIPESMWLTRFSYDEKKEKKKIEISGYADTASEIIPILEESALFEDVKFKSSIVKDKGKDKERLNVEAIVSSKQSAEPRSAQKSAKKKKKKK